MQKLNETPHHIEKWYDHLTRCWVVQLMNEAGDQIGDAVYVHSKREANLQEKWWKKDYFS